MRKAILTAVVSLAVIQSSQCQLAITESFSSASTNNTLTPGGGQGPDFWELSNFGSTPVDLSGYRFNDGDATLSGDADSTVFSGVTIAPGESIIFAQNNTPINTTELFVQWWGAANVPANIQVLFYTGNGQSSAGDSIVLWDAAATEDSDYLDRVDFGEAVRGRSVVYNTNSAAFGMVSSNGIGGAFMAATSDDEGSPGVAQAPVALAFTQHPTNTTGYAGFPVTFTAAATGLPKPRYQWLWNNNPILGETRPTLTLTNVQMSAGGNYTLVISNGLQTLVSSNAMLTVDAAPSAPTFISTPKTIDAYIGQSVTLSAVAQGNPSPTYQWRSNGIAITGQTANQLVLSDLQTNSSATYSVAIQNIVGTNAAAAVLTVTPKPRLLITEVQSTGSTEFADWWEITSFDTRPFNLKGYRFDDSSQSLASTVTLTNDIIINPGESVIFVESNASTPMSSAAFRGWWGSNNVPALVKIGTYTGAGVGLSSGGDAVYLWNAAATANSDFICGVTFAAAAQTNRQSFVYNVDSPGEQSPSPGSLTLLATNGLEGAFQASNGDTGSPGNVVSPFAVQIETSTGGVKLSWNSVAGRSYSVESRDGVAVPAWITRSNIVAAGVIAEANDNIPTTSRVYRVGLNLPFSTP